MKNYFSFLTRIPLFRGIASQDLPGMLDCLNARTSAYQKGEVVLLEGQPVRDVGIVLSGKIRIIKEDFMGNRTILAEIPPGGLFAESFSCAGTDRLPVTAVSAAESEILWIDYRRIVTTCSSACGFHTKLIENMLAILASKNILLNQKIRHLARRTTREKLLSYLSDQMERHQSRAFDIPFSRQELADYLCVDRSAMSAELSRLQREGVLKFQRSHFVLMEPENPETE